MGEKILSKNPSVGSVSYKLPNKHYIRMCFLFLAFWLSLVTETGETDGEVCSGQSVVYWVGEHGVGGCRGVLSGCSAEVSAKLGRRGRRDLIRIWVLTGWLLVLLQWTDYCDGIEVID